MKYLSQLFCVFILCFFFTASAYAAKVELASGVIFDGNIVKVSEEAVTISLNGNPMSIGYGQIVNVEPGPNDSPDLLGFVQKKMDERQEKINEQERKLQERIKSKKVELFMTTWCPYCTSLIKFFREKGIKFIKYDVEHDIEGIKKYRELNIKGVPVVRINGKVIRGYTPSSVWKELTR